MDVPMVSLFDDPLIWESLYKIVRGVRDLLVFESE